MNPAVSFVAVIAFGSVFGALGAFLSLPIAATIQAIINTYVRRHELIDSALLTDPTPIGAGTKDAASAPTAPAEPAEPETKDQA